MTTHKYHFSTLAVFGLFVGLTVVSAVVSVAGQTGAADQFGVYINRRPVREFSNNAREQIEGKKVDPGAAFKVTIKCTVGLAEDGKTYILKKPTLVLGGNTGDAAMQKLAHDAILAVGDAGWFGYLKAFEKSGQDQSVTISAEQNETQFQAKIVAQQRDANTAMTIASALRVLFSLAGSKAQGDDAIFLKFTKASNEGKNLHLTMAAPKEIIAGMIQRELAKQKQ